VQRALLRSTEQRLLGEEPGQRRDAGERTETEGGGHERDRHRPAQAAHRRHRVRPNQVDHCPGSEEEQRLVRRVAEQVEERRRPPAHRQPAGHVGQLAHGGVGEHPLDVVLRQRGEGGAEHGDGREDAEHRETGRRREEGGVEPGDEIDAGGHHGRRVDERADRGRPGHRVGQPHVQRELGGLADHAAEQQQRPGRHRRRRQRRHSGEHVGDPERPAPQAEGEDAEEEAHVTEAGHEKRLDRPGPGVGKLPVVADEEVRADAHHLPPHEQHEQVGGEDDEQHGRGEE
jgi:hypothetical protein